MEFKILEIINAPLIVIICGGLIVFVVTNAKQAKQETRKTKNKVIHTSIESSNLNHDMEKYKTMRLIPSIFSKNAKVVKAYRSYVTALNAGRNLYEEEPVTMRITTNNLYDDLIAEIGRDVKVYRRNEFYQDNQEYLPHWISSPEKYTNNLNYLTDKSVKQFTKKKTSSDNYE